MCPRYAAKFALTAAAFAAVAPGLAGAAAAGDDGAPLPKRFRPHRTRPLKISSSSACDLSDWTRLITAESGSSQKAAVFSRAARWRSVNSVHRVTSSGLLNRVAADSTAQTLDTDICSAMTADAALASPAIL